MQTSFFGDSFDTTGVDTANPKFDPVPAGWYAAVLTEIDMKKTDVCLMAKCQFKIADGPLAGRVVFENSLTFKHATSQPANDIGQRKLAQWCDAVNISRAGIKSAEPFLNKTVKIKVSVQPGREYNGKSYGPSNRVDAFERYDGMPVQQTSAPMPTQRSPVSQTAAPAAPAVTATPPAHVTAAPAATGQRTMPWQRRA